MERRATIYIGEDRILVCPECRTTQGVRFTGSIHRLAHGVSVDEILTESDKALAECNLVSQPIDLKERFKQFLAATGEKTWNAVSRSFAYVGFHEEGDDGLVFYSGFPEKGAFLFRTEAHWRCKKSNRTDTAAAFRAAACISIEAQNLYHPPLLP